jgi:hypothetical protein
VHLVVRIGVVFIRILHLYIFPFLFFFLWCMAVTASCASCRGFAVPACRSLGSTALERGRGIGATNVGLLEQSVLVKARTG